MDLAVASGTPDIGSVFAFQDALYENTIKLVGEPPASLEQQVQSAFPGTTTERPNASKVLQFGKHKGMTLAEIDASVGSDGKTGRSYLEWLREKATDDSLKSAVRAYLG